MVDELPRTSTGKIQKNRLREEHAATTGPEMPVLTSLVDPDAPEFLANRAHQLALIDRLDEQLRLARRGRRRALRGPPPRARAAAPCASASSCCSTGTRPFLELSPLAAWGTEFTVGASVVTGIGVVSRRRVRDHRPRPDRARRRDEPLHAAEDAARAGDRPAQPAAGDQPGRVRRRRPAHPGRPVRARRADLPRPHRAVGAGASRPSRWCSATRRRAAPTCRACATTPCWSTEQAKVFLGGPPLVKMATGEDADDEELGGADMHARVSGPRPTTSPSTSSTRSASAAQIVAELNWRKLGPGPPRPRRRAAATTPTSCSASLPADLRVPFDPREVLARIVDGSRVRRVQAALRHQPGHRLGAGSTATRSASSPTHRGVLFSEEAKKATEFILLANQTDTPLVFLQNTTGYMVGTRLRAGRDHQGRRQDDQRRHQQRRAAPHGHHRRARYGAGNYGMCGRAYDPRFLFAWPNAKLAVMGAAQLAGVLSIVGRAVGRGAGPAVRRGRRPRPHAPRIEAQIEPESHAFVRHRPALRRRHHRPPRHPHRARHRAVGRPLQTRRRAPRLRRLPDVTA